MSYPDSTGTPSPSGSGSSKPEKTSGREPRSLILCFDGTSNKPIEDGTNVGKLFFALEKGDVKKQKCYYQPGIGTYVPPTKPLGWVSSGIARVADLAFAWFLQDHIIGGYRFLMNNYREGDKIVMFGFSRGAYTCRALAAMLSCVGLLSKDNEELIPFAYNLYNRSSEEGPYAAASFRSKVSREVSVEFVGLWDTVASVGVTGRTLPSSLNLGVIKHFRQGMALDERRAKFRQNPMHLAPEDITWDGAWTETQPYPPEKKGMLGKIGRAVSLSRVSPKPPPLGPSPNARVRNPDQTLHKDVWFAGTHSDVGGSENSKRDCNLSNVTLFWMLRELSEAKVKLLFKDQAFRRNPALQLQVDKPEVADKVVDYLLTGVEQDEKVPEDDLEDFYRAASALTQDIVNSKIRESLKGAWHFIEYIPTWKPYVDEHGRRCKRLSINFGRPRQIDHQNPTFHWSVALRHRDAGYTPKAKYGGEPVFMRDEEDKLVSAIWARGNASLGLGAPE